MEYNKDLCKRFVSDYKLPIPLVTEPYFSYFLNLYEDKYGSLSKYVKLCKLVDSRFDGDADKFLKEYYDIRDKIITTVLESDAYAEFNGSRDLYVLTEFALNKLKVSKNNVYNEQNIGNVYLSIDLKKANFQALKYVNNDIVLGADCYEDFIGQFTDMEYVSESKYTRQVILGKLNPSRQITVEKYLINKVWEVYSSKYVYQSSLVSMSNDELVIRLSDWLVIAPEVIEDYIYEQLGLEVSAEYYRLEGIRLVNKRNGDKRSMYYVKKGFDGDEKLMCVPITYHALVHCLYYGLPIHEYAYHFDYEGLDCKICEEFDIEVLK